jgi:hypothetical protein
MLSFEPECLYLTHFSRVREVDRLGARLLGLLDELVAMARSLPRDAQRHQALQRGQLEIFERSLRAHACTLDTPRIAELLAMDLELNAQGLALWLDKR